ncbi:NAD(P)H-binding protein [Pseudomonas borbori]
MKNFETPVFKLGLFGARSSLGSALLCELLSRQHEVVALLGELNALQSRPGLRTKLCDLFDAVSVSEAVAGTDAVICLYDHSLLPIGGEDRPAQQGGSLADAVTALCLGMPRAGVRRLLLVADFDQADPDQLARQHLLDSELVWTLVAAPQGLHGDWRLDDFLDPDHQDEERRRLRSIASGIADEAQLDNHLREEIRFRC